MSSSRYGSSRWTASNEASAVSKSFKSSRLGQLGLSWAHTGRQRRTSKMIRDQGLLARTPDPRSALAPTALSQANTEDRPFELLNKLIDGRSLVVEVEPRVDLEARREGVHWQQGQERLELVDRGDACCEADVGRPVTCVAAERLDKGGSCLGPPAQAEVDRALPAKLKARGCQRSQGGLRCDG
jgi:hypothetical protein